MKKTTNILFMISGLFLLLLSSCSHKPLDNEAASVEVYFSIAEKSQAGRVSCNYLGDVIGSDGNVIDNWFISNIKLTRGALNDIRNKAKEMGGDTVLILRNPLSYVTSTTMIGSVYRCKKY